MTYKKGRVMQQLNKIKWKFKEKNIYYKVSRVTPIKNYRA